MKRRWSHPLCVLRLLVAVVLLLTFRCCRGTMLEAASTPRSWSSRPWTPRRRRCCGPRRGCSKGTCRERPRSTATPRCAACATGWAGSGSSRASCRSWWTSSSPIDRHSGARGDEGRRYASCAVVGNSGILLAKEHGALIDGHDLVTRLNNAPVGNGRYARHVGAKTGLAFLNSNVLRRCTGRTGCRYCRAYGERVPILTYMCNAAHFVEHAVCSADASPGSGGAAAPVIVTDPRLDALCARLVNYYSLRRFVRDTGRPTGEWGKRYDEGMFHYSSGMQAVVAAAGVCGRVSVFGFGKDPGPRHHYHRLQKGEVDLHDYEAEYEFYRDLEARPEAIPFLQDSGFRLPPAVVYR